MAEKLLGWAEENLEITYLVWHKWAECLEVNTGFGNIKFTLISKYFIHAAHIFFSYYTDTQTIIY